MSPHAGIDLQSEFGDRFHYWSGASGKRYIHSVYAADDCPPLPGAVFLEVEVLECGARRPVRCGRFSPLWDMPSGANRSAHGLTREMHVHLLAGSDADADTVLNDIREGLGLALAVPANAAAPVRKTAVRPSPSRGANPSPHQGFNEPAALPLFASVAA